jgi:hypothetical protein
MVLALAVLATYLVYGTQGKRIAHAVSVVLTPSVVSSRSRGPAVSLNVASSSDVRGRPSLSPDFINQVLTAYRSPAAGLGQTFYDLSVQYGIDDAFPLAFFGHESGFGVNGEAASTHSIGNLRCYTGAACVDQDRGGYAYYASWAQGAAAWYALIAGPAYVGDGLVTVPEIISRYAPTADHNDESAYSADVMAKVTRWRAGQV